MRLTEALQRLLPKGSFVRNVSMLAGGAAAGQAIIVLASPILTRFYSPEEFGLLAVFGGLLAIVASVASLRYHMAIPLPECDDEAEYIALLSLAAVIVTSLLTAVGLYFLGELVARALNSQGLGQHLWLLPIGVFMFGVFEVLSYWAIRNKAFAQSAQARVAQSVTMVGAQLGGHGLGSIALLLGQVTAHAVAVVRLAAAVFRKRRSTRLTLKLGRLLDVAHRYRRFPIYSTWSVLFNTVGTQLPPVLFGALFNPAAAGLYLLAHRVLALPLSLLGRAIADVFLANAAEAKRSGRLGVLVNKVHDYLAHIGMPPAAFLMLIGPDLFAQVFGPEWRQAGEFARWMAPWLYLVFIAAPLSSLASVLWKQAHEMVFQIGLFVTRLAAILLASQSGNMLLAVSLFSMGSAACLAVFSVWSVKSSGGSLGQMATSNGRAAFWSIVLVAPLAVAYVIGIDTAAGVGIGALSLALLAGRCLFLLNSIWTGAKKVLASP